MNDMIEVRTADLIGPALDWAVGMAVDGTCIDCTGSVPRWKFPTLEASVWGGDVELGDIERYSPSTDWSQGGPLIEKYRIRITPEYEGQWYADLYRDDEEPLASAEGSTALIAVCRSVVAVEFGEVVQAPKELMP